MVKDKKNNANSVTCPAFTFKTEKELEDAVCEAIKKSECPVCRRLFCTECTIPQGSGLNCHEQQSVGWGELGHAQSSGLSCNERQRINWYEKRTERSMLRKLGPRISSTRHSQSKFNGRRMGDIPQTSSRSVFFITTTLIYDRRKRNLIVNITSNIYFFI